MDNKSAIDMNAMEQAGLAAERPDLQVESAETGSETVILPAEEPKAEDAELPDAEPISEGEKAVSDAAETAGAETLLLFAEEPKAEDDWDKQVAEYPAKGTPENPHGTLDPAKPFHWSGRNIMDVEFQGSADDTAACYAAATLAGAVMCNPRANPDYKDPNPIIQPEVGPTEYQRGWNDADAAYQDLKALVQNFAAVQAAETNDDVDQKYPFVAYVRHNR